MGRIAKLSLCAALAAALAAAPLAAQEQEPVPREDAPRDIYRQLNALRVNPAEVYFVRDLQLRRGEVRLALTEGKLALLEDYRGRLTGAVFTGAGRALIIPRDPAERRSLVRFLEAPLLDQAFSRAYLRFTDDSGERLREAAAAGGRRIAEPAFVSEWDTALAGLNPWHSLRILADLLAERPRPYFYAGLAGGTAGSFDVLVDQRREEAVLAGQASLWDGRRFYDVWVSFAPEGTPPAPPPFRATHIAVDTTIHFDAALDCRAELTLEAVASGERLVPLEMSRHMRIQSVTDGAGRELTFFQNEEINRDEILQRGNDSVFIILPEAPAAGQPFRLRMRYGGHVIADAGNGVYYVGERGSWYPHVGGTDQFAAFSLSFRWPRILQLVATGRRVAEGEEGEWRTGRWESEGPAAVAGFNLSDYVLEVADARQRPRIELYANRQLEQSLAARFRPRLVVQQRRRYLPGQSPRPNQPDPPYIPPTIVPAPPVPSPAGQMKELGRDLAEAIAFYEKLHGPFPFERLAITQIPGAFGQSWPGLLYISTLTFLSPDVHQSLGLGERATQHYGELLPYHELAHQWWGNVAGWHSYREQWIFEGLANYLGVLFVDSKRPGALAEWLERYRQDLLAPAGEVEGPAEQAGPLTLGYRLRSAATPNAYPTIVYGKGTWVWHMLRTMLREPGSRDPDARFRALLTGLLERYRHRGITNASLRREVEALMTPAMDLEDNGTMEWFFEQWVHATGIPHYAAEFEARPAAGGFVVRGTLRQSNVPRTFTAAVPIYAAPARGGRPVLLGTVITLGEATEFEFTAPFAPARLQIDPQQTLLRTVD